MQMSRFGDSCESRFRQNFQKNFDWVGYNSEFTSQMAGHRIALAIDPSHIDKSGNHTPGVGYFWSGCASAAKHGLEILDIAVIDADEKDAVHLKAVQTVDTVRVGRPPRYIAGMKNPNSLTAWYLRALAQEKDALQKISNILSDACTESSILTHSLPQLVQELRRVLMHEQQIYLIDEDIRTFAGLSVLGDPVEDRVQYY